ncbi:MAG: YqgE/AlgH family protein [Magnetococcus sp. WYHC-3]
MTRNETTTLKGRLLVAMPSLQDPHFERSVIFLCAHSEDGALGIVVNHTYDSSVKKVVEQLGIPWQRLGFLPVFNGGPVSPERGFVLYEGALGVVGEVEILPSVFLGTSPDVLRALGHESENRPMLFALGYAGWAEGQVEEELRDNSWLVCPPQRHLLFDLPAEQRYGAALRVMGVDPATLVDSGVGSVN